VCSSCCRCCARQAAARRTRRHVRLPTSSRAPWCVTVGGGGLVQAPVHHGPCLAVGVHSIRGLEQHRWPPPYACTPRTRNAWLGAPHGAARRVCVFAASSDHDAHHLHG
jgi:hypothetical protein